jgi:hypothetical protein
MKNLLATLLFLSSTLLIQSNANAAFVQSQSGSAAYLSIDYDSNSNLVYFAARFDKGLGNAFFTLTDTFTTPSTIVFDWFISSQSSGQSELGYLLNGTEFNLLGSNLVTRGGPISVSVAAGDSFGWFLNHQATGDGQVTGVFENISIVSSPSAVPENNIAMLMAAGLIGIAALRKKALV